MSLVYMTHPEHGATYVSTPSEKEYNLRYGWKVDTPPEVKKPKEEKEVKPAHPIESLSTVDLKKKYFEVMGKKPHHLMNRHNIEKAIKEHDGDSQ